MVWLILIEVKKIANTMHNTVLATFLYLAFYLGEVVKIGVWLNLEPTIFTFISNDFG